MPYKDPERKRQWEQQHRKQRNARRRLQSQAVRSGRADVPNSTSDTTSIVARLKQQTPDPAPKEQASGWKILVGLAVGLGALLLAALAGLDGPPPGHAGPSPGSGSAGM